MTTPLPSKSRKTGLAVLTGVLLFAGIAQALFQAKFEGHQRETPFVPCNAAGVWIEPKFICRIQYKKWDAKVGLVEPKSAWNDVAVAVVLLHFVAGEHVVDPVSFVCGVSR